MRVINYLIDYKGFHFIFKDGHENYNPVTNIILEKNGEKQDVQTTFYIYFDGYTPNTLGGFLHSIGL
jgi:hypothetical protein